MKKSLFSYIFLLFLIITFLAGTYIYATGRDFVFKTKENITNMYGMNDGLNYISDVTNQIDRNNIQDLENAFIDKYTEVINNIGTPNGQSNFIRNLPTTPYVQQTRSSPNDYVLLSTNPYDFIPKHKTVKYLPVNAHSNLYIQDQVVFTPTDSISTA